jgi:hypothetical protein
LKSKISGRKDAHLQFRFLGRISYDSEILPNLQHFYLECIEQNYYPTSSLMVRKPEIEDIFRFIESRTPVSRGFQKERQRQALKSADLKWVDVLKEWGALNKSIVKMVDKLRRNGLLVDCEVKYFTPWVYDARGTGKWEK